MQVETAGSMQSPWVYSQVGGSGTAPVGMNDLVTLSASVSTNGQIATFLSGLLK